MPGDPVSLDWMLSNQAIDGMVFSNVHEGLISFGVKNEPIPQIAQSWKISADRKTYTFKIKPGVLWSDGTPLVAQHFVDAWKRLLSPLTGAYYGYLFYDVQGAEDFQKGKITDISKVGFAAPDSLTLSISLNRPSSQLLSILGFWATFPAREDLIRRFGNLWTKPGNLVTLGAFRLDSIETGKRIVLNRNAKYHGARGNVDRVELHILPPENAETEFQAGKLDLVLRIPQSIRESAALKPRVRWLSPVRTKRLTFNTQQYPLSSVRFREAVIRAVDRAKLLQLMGAGYTRGASLVPPGFAGYDAKAGLAFDLKEARKMLRRSGVDVSTLTLTILVPMHSQSGPESLRAAQFVEKAIETHLGVPVNLDLAEDAERWTLYSRNLKFSMLIHDWEADYPDSDSYYALYSQTSSQVIQLKRPDYDEKVLQARDESSASRRALQYRALDKIVVEQEMTVLPLFYSSVGILAKPGIQGLNLSPFYFSKLSGVKIP